MKNTWTVLGCPDEVMNGEVEFGTFDTKKGAEKCIFKNIKKFPKYGMGLIKNPYLQAQWNYTIDEKGAVWVRPNHHDLW